MNESNRPTSHLLLLVAVWYTSSSIAVLLVKALFSGRIDGLSPFRFPLLLTFSSNVISTILALYVSSSREAAMDRYQQRFAMLIGATTAGEIGLSNWALSLLTVVLATMMKGIAPFLVMAWGVVLGVYKPSFRLCVVVTTVCVGLALAVNGQKNLQDSRRALSYGVAAQFLSGVLSGFRWVITQIFVKGSDGEEEEPHCLSFLFRGQIERPMSAIVVIRTTAPYTAVSIAPFVLLLEGPDLVSWFMSSTVMQGLVVGSTIFSVGICVFVLLWSEYALVKSTSSLTVSIGFVAKEVLVICGGIILFGDELTWMSVVGFCLVQVGVVAYAFQKKVVGSSRLPK